MLQQYTFNKGPAFARCVYFYRGSSRSYFKRLSYSNYVSYRVCPYQLKTVYSPN